MVSIPTRAFEITGDWESQVMTTFVSDREAANDIDGETDKGGGETELGLAAAKFF